VLQDKDIIVMGSDGLYDNLFNEDIVTCIYPQYKSHQQSRHLTGELANPTAAAECLAKKAEIKSNNPNYLSPFARGAQEVGVPYQGGKPDDITVIVAQVNFKY
jgi:serine/threonine protein phosphatase PrpC